ncbi:unnamed protein product, partial [Brenthis ino]
MVVISALFSCAIIARRGEGGASVRECACGGEAARLQSAAESRARRLVRSPSLHLPHTCPLRPCSLSRCAEVTPTSPLGSVLGDFTPRHNRWVSCEESRDESGRWQVAERSLNIYSMSVGKCRPCVDEPARTACRAAAARMPAVRSADLLSYKTFRHC